jgi:hypothetical protein
MNKLNQRSDSNTSFRSGGSSCHSLERRQSPHGTLRDPYRKFSPRAGYTSPLVASEESTYVVKKVKKKKTKKKKARKTDTV